ncbi:MAG: glucokinase [Caldimonas sp.]
MSDLGRGHPRLLADVGGTHARFGWVAAPGAGIECIRQYRCSDHASLESIVAFYLADQRRPAPRSAAIGIATTVDADRVTMTNLPWSFSIEAMRERFALDRLVVLNDFAALALATPLLGVEAFRAVGGGAARPGAPIAVLGPGTGLGVAGLLQGPHGTWLPVVGEGGHATLCAVDAVEEELLAIVRRHWPHVSAERVLSGSGLVNLHRALGDRAGETVEALTPADIVTRALDGRDARCTETVERFLGFLGSFAGNLALTLGAQGGVYIGGGIVPRLGDRIARSCFRERFESKGRFRSYLARVPTWVITTPDDAALRGADRALDDRLARDADAAEPRRSA